MMQVMVQAARDSAGAAPTREPVEAPGSRTVRLLARLAQGGARGREETKSKMALMAHRLKLGYHHLGEVLADSGRLPDADLVFFFDRAELPRVVGDARHRRPRASGRVQRREALAFQQSLEFDDVSVGRPAPILARPPGALTDDQIVGSAGQSRHRGRHCARGEVDPGCA